MGKSPFHLGAVNEKSIITGLLTVTANIATVGTVLVVVSDQAKLYLKNGKVMQTGFFLNELMELVQTFIAVGHTVVFATPSGKAPSIEQKSDDVNFLCEAIACCGLFAAGLKKRYRCPSMTTTSA